MMTLNELIEIVLKGMFNGVGTAFGTYLAVTHAIKHGEKWMKRFLKRFPSVTFKNSVVKKGGRKNERNKTQ